VRSIKEGEVFKVMGAPLKPGFGLSGDLREEPEVGILREEEEERH
jgi:hypothetical protein